MGWSDPRAIIAEAHANTKIVGSSTACVAVLRQLSQPKTSNDGGAEGAKGEEGSGVGGGGGGGSSQVMIGNVGDAGAMVARGDEVVFATPPQQHEFNCPFQLGWKEFYPESDTAADAETFTVDVLPGGVWSTHPPHTQWQPSLDTPFHKRRLAPPTKNI